MFIIFTYEHVCQWQELLLYNAVMTDSNKRQAAKEASKEALIRSAMQLMPDKGLDVSLDELCNHAGYTRGAFYVHFKKREDLQLEIMNRVGRSWLDSIFGTDPVAGPEDLMTMVQRFLSEMLSGDYPITRKGGLRPHQLLDLCARSERIKAAYLALVKDSINRLKDNIRVSQQLGQLDKELDAEQVANLLLVLAVGVHTMYDLDYPIDFSAGVSTLLQLIKPF